MPDPPAPASADIDAETLELLSSIPRDASNCLTSLGSIDHEEGECSPCQYWFKGACLNGLACHRCHFMHEGQRPRRLRPSNQSRQRQKKRIEKGVDGGQTCVKKGKDNDLAVRLAAAAAQLGLRIACAVTLREEAARCAAAAAAVGAAPGEAEAQEAPPQRERSERVLMSL